MAGFVPPIPSAPQLNRRAWLQMGGVAALAALGGISPAAQRRALPGFGKAKSVILIYTSGGQSQIDTWDPKPSAPAEVRGEFKPIRSAVPGLLLCEHMPRLAHMADRYTVVRSVCHDDVDHGSASYLALTGFFHQKKSANPPPKPTDLPTYGAILQRLRPSRQVPHSAVHINGPAYVPEIQAPGQFAGLLGRSCEPLLIGDPTHEPLALEGLDPSQELPAERARGRRALLKRLENAGFVTRRRNPADERQVRIHLTEAGRALQQQAMACPATVLKASGQSMEQLMQMKEAAVKLRDAFNGFNAAR